jgi:hypothetical protein
MVLIRAELAAFFFESAGPDMCGGMSGLPSIVALILCFEWFE